MANIVVHRQELLGAVSNDSEQQKSYKHAAPHAFLRLWLGSRSERSGAAENRSLRWVSRAGCQRTRGASDKVVVVHTTKTRSAKRHRGIYGVAAEHHC